MTDSPRAYTVLLDLQAGQAPGDVARALEAAGFVVDQELEAIGVILGRIDEPRVAALRKIPGVASVEENRTVRTQGDNTCPDEPLI